MSGQKFFQIIKKYRLFSLWVFLVIFFALLGEVNAKVVGLSALACGLSTMLIWKNKGSIAIKVKKWKSSPTKKFILLGSLGALWAEFVYWFFERSLGGAGIAAHPNLLIDWLGTIPWYIIMVVLFWQVLKKYNYSAKEILVLGGIYELGADGILGSILKGNLIAGIITGIIGFPIFIMTYSIIVLPPAYLLGKIGNNFQKAKNKQRYIYALLPLLGLIPYIFILLMIF